MSISVKEVLKFINLAREYPKYYVSLVEQQISSFVDEKSMKLSQEIIYKTIEGKSAWREAR